METFLHEHGLLALFTLSLLASTLVPLGSEWLLVLVLLDGADPWIAVSVAGVGNTLGACTSYALGRFGGPWIARALLGLDDAGRERAERTYLRWGAWSLLGSWLPFVGDPLCVVAGVFRLHPGTFTGLVFVGKTARYALVAWAVAVSTG